MSAAIDNESGSDFELNLAPVIDCFTVLITYMLVSASFISLEMLDVQVATTAPITEEQQLPKEPPRSLSIMIEGNQKISVKMSGKTEQIISLEPKADGKWDYDKMKTLISKAKTKWPELQEINVNADPKVQYKDVIGAVENLKKVMPKVTIRE
jgi:biopolymer transport protein ExbD